MGGKMSEWHPEKTSEISVQKSAVRKTELNVRPQMARKKHFTINLSYLLYYNGYG